MSALHAALHEDSLLLWTRDGATPTLDVSARPTTAILRLPDGATEQITALEVPAANADHAIAAARRVHGAAPEIDVIGALLQHAAACVVRQELVPALRRELAEDGDVRFRAAWRMVPRPAARDALDVVITRLPEVALQLTPDGCEHATALRLPRQGRVRRFLDAVADAHVRRAASATAASTDTTDTATTPHDRWVHALSAPRDRALVDGPSDALDRMSLAIEEWSDRVLSPSDAPFRLCVRLEEPDDPTEIAGDEQNMWTVRFLLQARDDPSVLIELADAWHPRGPEKIALRKRGFHTGAHLLAALNEAARVSSVVSESLTEREPTQLLIDTERAHAFLTEEVPLLEGIGVGAFVPAWWRGRGGRFQVGVRAEVRTAFTGGRRSLDSLNLATLVGYDWRVAIGDSKLSHQELRTLAAQKSPLINVRGRWVEIDPDELRHAIAHVERMAADPTAATRGPAGDGGPDALEMTLAQLLRMSMRGGTTADGVAILGIDGGDAESLLTRVRAHETPEPVPPPAGLRADLRPYQQRGFEWLRFMAQLELGACLADDMGLGKSVQTLAVIQDTWERTTPDQRRPTLIVAPTSVLTNWSREAARFTPELPVRIHHGPGRPRGTALADAVATSAIVITSYAVLSRDIETLETIDWQLAVLDEAQNIKNPGTHAARAARRLNVPARFALTGTPIENHVGDLWSIMEFLVPGLLGTQVDYRRKYLIPIQEGGFPEAADRLRSLTEPFILRRTKRDRTVIDDLPERIETTEYCSLTEEQAALYEAIVGDAKRVLRAPRTAYAGIERRGLILATISKLKQACNHPAHLLGDNSRIDGRSGKLARLEALVEDILDRGERTLIFTQFVEMGELLRQSLTETFGREVLFLHGGTSRAARDRMVERFQSSATDAPPIFVLSLKAGGSGLNLTAATHVIHYDRWWNPATEQQASDRAFRIGQTRDVQIHALVCAGTIEERIDSMITSKRSVAESIVGTGEQWITELGDDELLGLLELREATLLQPGRLDDIAEEEWKRASL
jgi:hypothetical protein